MNKMLKLIDFGKPFSDFSNKMLSIIDMINESNEKELKNKSIVAEICFISV